LRNSKERKTNLAHAFEDIPVLGKLPLQERARKFDEVGDVDTAKDVIKEAKAISKGSRFLGRRERPCENTAHAYGFIPFLEEYGKGDSIQITHAGLKEPDFSLKNSRVNIRLDALRAADYPGKGIHRVLFDFYAKNQLPGKQVEELHFNQTYRVMEAQAAGIIGYPIFIGLNVGTTGLDFRCRTVNVKNDDDERILNFLDSDVFKSGLTLATTAQPAIAPLANLAVGITRMVAGRNKNVSVQEIDAGLDFEKAPTGARLAQGSYVCVQIPQKDELIWDWENWVFNPKNGFVVNKNNNRQLIPYNYLIIRVSKYEEI
jgi:hypothetical protein